MAKVVEGVKSFEQGVKHHGLLITVNRACDSSSNKNTATALMSGQTVVPVYLILMITSRANGMFSRMPSPAGGDPLDYRTADFLMAKDQHENIKNWIRKQFH